MEVKYLGFTLETSLESIAVSDLLEEFCDSSGSSDTSKNLERRIYLNGTDPSYYRGLVITVKDQKRFCKLADSRTGLKISVENLRGDDKLMDFNFFVINKKNNIGLYQHYFQSCSLLTFGEYLKNKYRLQRQKLIEDEIGAFKLSNDGSISKKKEREIRRKYKTYLYLKPLFRQEDLANILQEFEKIKSFEYEFSTLSPDVLAATPLSGYVEKKTEKITFKSTHDSGVLASAIAGAIQSFSPKRGRVCVEDALGESSTIPIFNMPDTFGVEDFDAVALKLDSLDMENFEASSYIQELIEICEADEFEHIFQADVI